MLFSRKLIFTPFKEEIQLYREKVILAKAFSETTIEPLRFGKEKGIGIDGQDTQDVKTKANFEKVVVLIEYTKTQKSLFEFNPFTLCVDLDGEECLLVFTNRNERRLLPLSLKTQFSSKRHRLFE